MVICVCCFSFVATYNVSHNGHRILPSHATIMNAFLRHSQHWLWPLIGPYLDHDVREFIALDSKRFEKTKESYDDPWAVGIVHHHDGLYGTPILSPEWLVIREIYHGDTDRVAFRLKRLGVERLAISDADNPIAPRLAHYAFIKEVSYLTLPPYQITWCCHYARSKVRALALRGRLEEGNTGPLAFPSVERVYLSGEIAEEHLTSLLTVWGTTLRVLDLSLHDDLRDISFVKHCAKLEELGVDNSERIRDISPVTFCKQLRCLALVDCMYISDISCLSECNALEQVILNGCVRVQDVSHLLDLPFLRMLDLIGCCSVTEMSMTRRVNEQLEHLLLDDCTNLADISFVSRCPGLLALSLCECRAIVDIRAIADCSKLRYLDISCTRITQFAPLGACTELIGLNLEHTTISDLTILASCMRLERLVLCYCKNVVDLDPLAACARLKRLLARYSSVNRLQGLARCLALNTIDLAGTNVYDITPILDLPELRDIDIFGCLHLDETQEKLIVDKCARINAGT